MQQLHQLLIQGKNGGDNSKRRPTSFTLSWWNGAISTGPESFLFASQFNFEKFAPVFFDVYLHETLKSTGFDNQIPFGRRE